MNALVPLLVALPLLGAAVTLVFGRNTRLQAIVTVVTLALVSIIAATLLVVVDRDAPDRGQVGGWQAPFGIVLSSTGSPPSCCSSRASCCSRSCCSRSARARPTATGEAPVSIFNPTYLILAAGIFDAFIAGDLFNLYVGFEMLLVACYVLITLGGTE